MAGGRLYWRRSVDTEVGASFIEILGAGRIIRQDVGLDARHVIARSLTLIGYAIFTPRELRFAEIDQQLAWQATPTVWAALDYRRTAPDLFLPRTSIFAVFSDETRDEIGATAQLRLAPVALRLFGDYHVVVAPEGVGHRGALKLSFAPDRARDSTLGVELRVLYLPTSGYVQARAWSTRRLGPLFSVTADLDAYWLERPINGQSFSFTAAATAGWDFHPGWRLVVAAIADTTPLVERRGELMLKLVYHHTLHVREVRP
jgi:hypothetical protein